MKRFWLWDIEAHEDQRSLAILFMRMFVSLMMMTHGLQKVANFQELSTTFLDPLGIGILPSLIMSIFAELVCSALLFFGFLTRISSAILVVNMVVAAFFALFDKPFATKELALLYLGIYVVITVLGGGKYSIDSVIFNNKGDSSSLYYRNISSFERILRLVVAFVLWYFILSGIVTSKLVMIIMVLLSVPPVITSFWGYCWLYSSKGRKIRS